MLRDPAADHEWLRPLGVRRGARSSAPGWSSFSMLDNTDKAYVFPMVDPPAPWTRRRRGAAGGAGRTVRRAAAAPRSPPTPPTPAPRATTPPPVRFAAAARLPRRQHRDQPSSAPAGRRRPSWTRWTPSGWPHRDGYTVETFVDGIPDELLPSYCAAGQPADRRRARRGEVDYEEAATTPEIVREHIARNRASAAGCSTPWRRPRRRGRRAVRPGGAAGGRPRPCQWGTFVAPRRTAATGSAPRSRSPTSARCSADAPRRDPDRHRRTPRPTPTWSPSTSGSASRSSP